MNKFIKEQLMKTRTPLPEWDDNTTHFVITGKRETKTNFQLNVSYEVCVDDSFFGPAGDTIRSNWNRGIDPPEAELYVTIEQDMGKMKQVRALGKTTHQSWVGWLPESVMIVR